MSVPYINFSAANHTGIVLGSLQSIQRRMNIRPDWTEVRCVAMAAIVGGTTIDDGIQNLGRLLNPSTTTFIASSSPINKFYFGLKNSSLNLPETNQSKFIGIGVGSASSVEYFTGYNGSTSYIGGCGGANQLPGIKYTRPSQYGMLYGASIMGTSVSNFVVQPNESTAPNNRFQPLPIDMGSTENITASGLTSNFCTPVGFLIRIIDRGTENQKIFIHNYGGQDYAVTGAGWGQAYGFYTRKFSNLSESALDTEMNLIFNNSTAHSGGLSTTLDAPHSQYDLSGIDSFFIYWPFTTNRLILFNLKVKDYTI